MNNSIIVEKVYKKFGLSLRDAVNYGFIDAGRRLIGKGKNEILRPGEFWAVENISFCLEPGDALGIMGLNGSGKTTLLRILNGTYSPDKGSVTLKGRIGALIAAGAGFSPMLTGRENVYVSAALIGMTPSEIESKFDEILEFAGLESFIDMPVRNYSSGMSVRLGFAIAVLGSPDILLIDEILAVGDINFQKKCYERITYLRESGTTILLVSHSPGSIWAICNKALILHKGKSSGIIPVEDACKLYEKYNSQDRRNSLKSAKIKQISNSYDSECCGTGDVEISNFKVIHPDTGHNISEVEYGKPFAISMDIFTKIPIEDGILRCSVDSEMYKAASILDSYESSSKFFNLYPGRYQAKIFVPSPNLRPGSYSFTIAFICKKIGIHLFLEHNVYCISVIQSKDYFFYADFRSIFHLNSEFSLLKEEN